MTHQTQETQEHLVKVLNGARGVAPVESDRSEARWAAAPAKTPEQAIADAPGDAMPLETAATPSRAEGLNGAGW
jgi:hypothetical protein